MDKKGNSFERVYENLKKLTQLNEDKLSTILKIIDKSSGNLKHSDILETFGNSITEKDSDELYAALALLGHKFSHHKETFENDSVSFTRDTEFVKKIKQIFENMNQKTLDVLNLNFELNRIDDFKERSIEALRTRTMLRDIRDENGKLLGYLPLSFISFRFTDNAGKEQIIDIFLTMKGLKSFTSIMNKVEKDTLEVVNEYKQQLGDKVIER